MIQLGAVLALTCGLCGDAVGGCFCAPRHDDAARRSILSVLLAFLPAVVDRRAGA